MHGCVFDGWTEVVVIMVALAVVVAFPTAVPFNRVDVGWIAPVKMVTGREEVVRVEEEVREAFTAALVLKMRVTAPS